MPEISPTIFVQIASYRDPELVPTIKHCLRQAVDPSRLRFGIAWQHAQGENLDLEPYFDDHRFRIIDIPYEESRGCCWARNLLQKEYQSESYTLQIDSHMRFSTDWDLCCIKILESLRSEKIPKPVLTSYMPDYDPSDQSEVRTLGVCKMRYDRFTPEGFVLFRSEWFDPSEYEQPLRARFYSGHFVFADGSLVREVPHDPLGYFQGEEISIAARAFTHGFDLFHPHVPIVYHHYGRSDNMRHWDDRTDWILNVRASQRRNKQLFGIDGEAQNLGLYGFGQVRSLRDYENFAGIDFRNRRVTHDALTNQIPSLNLLGPDISDTGILHFKTTIEIPSEYLDQDDYCFLQIEFRDALNRTRREDLREPELQTILSRSSGTVKIDQEFIIPEGMGLPIVWQVWPFSTSQGWLPKLSGTYDYLL